MKMTPEEDAVYMGAFSKSKAKTVKERMAEAEAALKAHRDGGAMRAVNKGIKDGTLTERAMARRERIDQASGFGRKNPQ
jgi:hypothetical protein